MSTPVAVGESFDCRSCGLGVRGQKPGHEGWCDACRTRLIHESGRRAYIPAAAVGAACLWLVWWTGLLESPLMAFWLALGALLTFVTYKVARRVLFDVLRGRATGDGKA